jgi:molybdopterin converting factor small subunit
VCRMSAVVTTVIAAVSAIAAVASVLLYVYFGRRADLAAAREEALALAETRRQTIDDLRRRLEALEKRHKRAKERCAGRVRELQSALDKTRVQARNDAYQTQHLYADAVSGLLNDLRGELERKPPDVEAALTRIRKLLADERPAA